MLLGRAEVELVSSDALRRAVPADEKGADKLAKESALFHNYELNCFKNQALMTCFARLIGCAPAG